jgi:hypothetical protein
MIDLLLGEIEIQINNYLKLKGSPAIYKCVVGDITLHDKTIEGGVDEDILESVLISLVSIEEEQSMKNNYPLRQVGNSLIREKSSIYINVYILFTAKYATYDTALKAIGNVIAFFQFNKKVSFSAGDGIQEAVLNLHNIGFENLNNLWTVLGGRYLPSVMYKARVLMYQASPPLSAPVILEIAEHENLH